MQTNRLKDARPKKRQKAWTVGMWENAKRHEDNNIKAKSIKLNKNKQIVTIFLKYHIFSVIPKYKEHLIYIRKNTTF